METSGEHSKFKPLHDDNAMGSQNVSEGEEEEYNSDVEEEDMEWFLDTEETDLVVITKDEICRWPELRDQLKADLQMAKQ